MYTATSGIDDYETYVREEQQISAEEEVTAHTHTHTHIYIHTHTHTHTHTHI